MMSAMRAGNGLNLRMVQFLKSRAPGSNNRGGRPLRIREVQLGYIWLAWWLTTFSIETHDRSVRDVAGNARDKCGCHKHRHFAL